MRELAITGAGTISSLGRGYSDYKERFLRGKREDAGEFDIDAYCGSMQIRRNDHFTKLALASFYDLFHNFDYSLINPADRGAIWNTYYGPVKTVNEFLAPVITGGLAMASPMQFANTVINAALGKVSIEFKLEGISYMLCGTNPVFYAASELENRHARVVFGGAADDVKGPGRLYREGAACLGMERYQDAIDRNAPVLACVRGIGMTGRVDFSRDGARRQKKWFDAMKRAMEDAAAQGADITAIYRFSGKDEEEAAAIWELFPGRNLKTEAPAADYEAFLSAGEWMRLLDAILDMERGNEKGPVLVNVKQWDGMSCFILERR